MFNFNDDCCTYLNGIFKSGFRDVYAPSGNKDTSSWETSCTVARFGADDLFTANTLYGLAGL